MTELITYDTIRKAHRAEKQELALQRLPGEFFTMVRGWLDHKQNTQKDIASLRETESVKRLLVDLINRRQTKIVTAALHTVRGDVPPKDMTLDEEKFFDGLVNMLKKAGQEVKERMFGYDGIIEEKLESARAMVEEMKTAAATENNNVTQKTIAKNNADVRNTDSVQGTGADKIVSGNSIHNDSLMKLKIITDFPSFVDAEMKTHGPFRAGAEAELPNDVAQILLSRKVAEKI